jgi:hypothetical protein
MQNSSFLRLSAEQTYPDFADSSQARPALPLRLSPNRIVHKLLTLESALASAEPSAFAEPGSSRLTGSKRLKNSNQGLTANPRRPVRMQTRTAKPLLPNKICETVSAGVRKIRFFR